MRQLRILVPLAALATLVSMLILGSASSQAHPYVTALSTYAPGVAPKVEAPPAVPVGSPIVIHGSGFMAGEPINIFVVNAQANGARYLAPAGNAGMMPVAYVVPAAPPVAQGTPLGTTNADANGAFTFTIPASTTGQAGSGVFNLEAVGVDSMTRVRFDVTLMAAGIAATTEAPSSGEGTAGGMPPTGTNGTALLWQVLVAAVAIAAGGLLVWLAGPGRRRRRSAAPDSADAA